MNKNVFATAVIVFTSLLSGVNSHAQVNSCSSIFTSKSNASEFLQKATEGTYLEAIRAIAEMSADKVNPSIGFRLEEIESPDSLTKARESDLQYLAKAYGISLETINNRVISYSTLHSIIDTIAGERLRSESAWRVKNSKQRKNRNDTRRVKSYEEELSRVFELQKLKFLAHLAQVKLPGTAMHIGTRNSVFLNAAMRTSDLRDLVTSIGAPARLFTKKSIEKFFHISPSNLFFVKQAIPLFIPDLRNNTSQIDWNYVVRLVSIYKMTDKGEALPSLENLRFQIGIASYSLSEILNDGRQPIEFEFAQLNKWVKDSLSENKNVVERQTIVMPKADFELKSGESGNLVKVFFKMGTAKNFTNPRAPGVGEKSTNVVNELQRVSDGQPQKDISEKANSRRRNVMLPDHFNEYHGKSTSVSFSAFMKRKMEQAIEKFGISRQKLLNEFGIKIDLWEQWLSQTPDPELYNQRDLADKFLIALDQGVLPSGLKALEKQSKVVEVEKIQDQKLEESEDRLPSIEEIAESLTDALFAKKADSSEAQQKLIDEAVQLSKSPVLQVKQRVEDPEVAAPQQPMAATSGKSSVASTLSSSQSIAEYVRDLAIDIVMPKDRAAQKSMGIRAIEKLVKSKADIPKGDSFPKVFRYLREFENLKTDQQAADFIMERSVELSSEEYFAKRAQELGLENLLDRVTAKDFNDFKISSPGVNFIKNGVTKTPRPKILFAMVHAFDYRMQDHLPKKLEVTVEKSEPKVLPAVRLQRLPSNPEIPVEATVSEAVQIFMRAYGFKTPQVVRKFINYHTRVNMGLNAVVKTINGTGKFTKTETLEYFINAFRYDFSRHTKAAHEQRIKKETEAQFAEERQEKQRARERRFDLIPTSKPLVFYHDTLYRALTVWMDHTYLLSKQDVVDFVNYKLRKEAVTLATVERIKEGKSKFTKQATLDALSEAFKYDFSQHTEKSIRKRLKEERRALRAAQREFEKKENQRLKEEAKAEKTKKRMFFQNPPLVEPNEKLGGAFLKVLTNYGVVEVEGVDYIADVRKAVNERALARGMKPFTKKSIENIIFNDGKNAYGRTIENLSEIFGYNFLIHTEKGQSKLQQRAVEQERKKLEEAKYLLTNADLSVVPSTLSVPKNFSEAFNSLMNGLQIFTAPEAVAAINHANKGKNIGQISLLTVEKIMNGTLKRDPNQSTINMITSATTYDITQHTQRTKELKALKAEREARKLKKQQEANKPAASDALLDLLKKKGLEEDPEVKAFLDSYEKDLLKTRKSPKND